MWFVVGTAAELIKMFPLIDRCRKSGRTWNLIATGQSGESLWRQYTDFQLPQKNWIALNNSHQDLQSSAQALKWFLSLTLVPAAVYRKRILKLSGRNPSPTDLWFVHGDTLSTLAGARIGHALGAKVVHVEAGLRSHDWRHPFPEEINRRLASRSVSIHLAPDETAVQNLNAERVKGQIVNTNGNTVMDSLRSTIESVKASNLPPRPYVLANLHRFENLNSQDRWKFLVEVVLETSKKWPVHFVLHPPAQAKLNSDLHNKTMLQKAGVTFHSRMPFGQFAHLLHGAEWVLTDGGSNQEECFYLGKPCLILREKTERTEGLQTTCVLSRKDWKVVKEFLESPQKYQHAPFRPQKSPTDLIFEALGLDK